METGMDFGREAWIVGERHRQWESGTDSRR